MCLFKKKKPVEPINSKFKVNQSARFKNRHGEIIYGRVYAIRKTKDDKILYDIQVGGECPYIKTDIPEEEVF